MKRLKLWSLCALAALLMGQDSFAMSCKFADTATVQILKNFVMDGELGESASIAKMKESVERVAPEIVEQGIQTVVWAATVNCDFETPDFERVRELVIADLRANGHLPPASDMSTTLPASARECYELTAINGRSELVDEIDTLSGDQIFRLHRLMPAKDVQLHVVLFELMDPRGVHFTDAEGMRTLIKRQVVMQRREDCGTEDYLADWYTAIDTVRSE